VALLRSVLGDTQEAQAGWWSSLKRSVKREESERIGVKVAACQSLGRLGAYEANQALEQLSRHPNPALRRAAEHALEHIRSAAPES
jgi:HEAT repeat protein